MERVDELHSAWMRLFQLLVGEIFRQLNRRIYPGVRVPSQSANEDRIDQGRGVSAPPIHNFFSYQKRPSGWRCGMPLALAEGQNVMG